MLLTGAALTSGNHTMSTCLPLASIVRWANLDQLTQYGSNGVHAHRNTYLSTSDIKAVLAINR